MIFGSDNQAGASDRVLDAISDAYRSHHDAYGTDALTAAAVEALRATFETDLTAFFVSSGSAANMLALSTMVQPWDGVVCHHQAHILLDESTGPSLFTGGASLLPVPDRDLRLAPDRLESMLDRLPSDVPHNVRPRALSITQANECGQVHTVDEIAALTHVARERDLRVHMDGARFANAVAMLGVHPGDVTWRAGVDVLCLGASKNGAVAAEAIVFFDRDLAVDVEFRLKRTGHLTSKGGSTAPSSSPGWPTTTGSTSPARRTGMRSDSAPNCPGSTGSASPGRASRTSRSSCSIGRCSTG